MNPFFLPRGNGKKLSPLFLPPDREIPQRLLVGWRIEAEDTAALAHLLDDEILERGRGCNPPGSGRLNVGEVLAAGAESG